MATGDKKKHHYIPITYLKNFADDSGKLRAFLKDYPDKEPLYQKPENIAYQRYYYSQPLPDGGYDNNTLEDLWSTVETEWTPLVQRWQTKDNTNDKLEELFQFLGLMRVRVPAIRDSIELMLAEHVRSELLKLDAAGKLPPMPPEISNLYDGIQIPIDPHMSIHAMASMMSGFAEIADAIGLEIIENKTNIPFISSDNPLVIYDPAISESALRPYEIPPFQKRIELLLPISPQLLLLGRSSTKEKFSHVGLEYGVCGNRKQIMHWNRMIARYGYRMLFAHNLSSIPLFKKYSSTSPVMNPTHLDDGNGGHAVHFEYKFGKRKSKPKWDATSPQ